MKNKKGFTLIELLAVIVILGLLMAIAIPSVTRYITQSRKKTVVSTVNSYVKSVMNEVNDLGYTFTNANTIYAVPIECVALESGGEDPFGEWMQASSNYWAYVLVQYDDTSSSYTYGFTFKDSAGYELTPISQNKIKNAGTQVQTGVSLSKPVTGLAKDYYDEWDGFKVDENTLLVVLTSSKENSTGDGINTCTLAQKGKNYEAVQKENKDNNIGEDAIKLSNIIKLGDYIKMTPTLKTFSLKKEYTGYTSDYVFYPQNTNLWRVIDIRSDGTIEIVSDGVASDNFPTTGLYGYLHLTEASMEAAKSYENSKYTIGSRSIGYGGQTMVIKDSGKFNSNVIPWSTTAEAEKHESEGGGDSLYQKDLDLVKKALGTLDASWSYRLPSRSYTNYGTYYSLGLKIFSQFGNEVGVSSLYTSSKDPNTFYSNTQFYDLRPILTLRSGITEQTGSGTKADPYLLK